MSELANRIRQALAPEHLSAEKADLLARAFENSCASAGDVQNLLGQEYQSSYVEAVTRAAHRVAPSCKPLLTANSTTVLFLPPAVSLPALLPNIAATTAAGGALLGMGALAFAGMPQGLNPEFQVGEPYRRALERLRGPVLEFRIERNPMAQTTARSAVRKSAPKTRPAAQGTPAHTPKGKPPPEKDLLRKIRVLLRGEDLPVLTRAKLEKMKEELQAGNVPHERLEKMGVRVDATERALERRSIAKKPDEGLLDRRWEAESPGLKERAVQLRARRKNIKRFVDEGDYLRFTGRVNELIGRVATRQRYSEKGVEEMKREMAALEKERRRRNRPDSRCDI